MVIKPIAFSRRRGYAQAEIVAVISKYDLEGCRVVSKAELRKVQDDLDKKKVQLFCILFLTYLSFIQLIDQTVSLCYVIIITKKIDGVFRHK